MFNSVHVSVGWNPRFILAIASAALLLRASAMAQAYDVSPPVILQDFESSYLAIDNKMPDIFESGYGGVYFPPPGITLNGESVGYDVYDRFNLGSPGQTTLYGTQNEFESVVQGIHAFGGDAYVDTLWTWSNGINNSNNSSFSEFPGLTTVLQTTNPNAPGYNTLGYNTTTGDFYPTSDTNQDEEALPGLQHIDPASDYFLIRNPTTPGNPQNIPEGTGDWLGNTVANIPTASNAQYYPDDNAAPRYENDPALNETNIPIYSFNPSNPMSGTPVAENALGYLMRYTQWLIQGLGVDGLRYDGGNNTYPWVMNYLDLATYDMSDRTLLNGQQENVFTFTEVYTSNISTIQQYISKTALTNPAGTVGGDRDALDFPLYFAMTSNLSGNGTFGSGQNSWYNVVDASLDYADDGLMNGSSGVKFVADQDVEAPVLSNVAYAYTLMLPGNATVYYNGQNFNNESDNSSGGAFPQGGVVRNSNGSVQFDGSYDDAMTALGGPYASQPGPSNPNLPDANSNLIDGNISTLVDLRNRFGRGDYRQDWIEQNLLAFERVGSSLVLLSNATSSTSSNGDYDSRSFATQFAPGQILEEYTGNAMSTFADPQQNIPEFLQVYADSSSPTGAEVNVRFPRNVQFNSSTSSPYATDDGYLVYGVPTPTGSLNVTNVFSTLAGGTFSTSASNAEQLNGTTRFTSVSVVTAPSFQLQLTTNAAYLNINQNVSSTLDLVYDQDADGDNAQFTLDGGTITVGPDGTTSTVPGSNGETTTPGNVSYGYQNFAASSPGYYSANGNGSYSQTIDTADLSVGYHYIEVISFTHNSVSTAPPVYSDWYETIYVDRGTPTSTVGSFLPLSSNNKANRQLVVDNTDGTASSAYVYLNLPSAITNAQIMNMISTGINTINGVNYQGGLAGQIDTSSYAWGFNNLLSGNQVATIVTYRPDGNYAIQRITENQDSALSITGAIGAGLGDLTGNGTINNTDIFDMYQDILSGGEIYNPAADFNGDGLINLTDWQLLGQQLSADNSLPTSNPLFVPTTTLAFYDELSGAVPEPASGILLAIAGSGFMLRRRRRGDRRRG